MQTTARNADLSTLVGILQDQHARKLDVVAPASHFSARDGQLVVRGTEATIDADGVTPADGTYTPTTVFDSGVAEKLGIPVAYLRRMRADRPDLYDANVNGWLHGFGRAVMTGNPALPIAWADGKGALPDQRHFLLRLFRGDDGGTGVARAMLSDTYAPADNLDVLLAVLDGMRDSGTRVDVARADLTDRRMIVKVHAPEVAALAPRLLDGYTSPFTGQTGADNPVVFAGFRLTNSETGDGAFSITPEVTVEVCLNGMTMTRDAVRQVHLGGKLEAGTIRWAADTERKNLELVKAKARDAVTTFLSPEYLTAAVTRLEARAGEEVGTSEDAVRDLTKPLGYTQEQVAGIMDYYVRGGQFTRGGVVNAITAYSQTVEDGDTAHDLDARATQLLGV